MRLFVTGGAGFIGSNFIHFMLNKYPGLEITNLDNLSYCGNMENLKNIEYEARYHFIKEDITNRERVAAILSEGFDVAVNFAAESHVDRSIMDSSPFIETNIKGTQVLLEGIRQYGVSKFIQVSTDEVYGSVGTGKTDESASLLPNSPYAASKAAADLLCRAYWRTYDLPILITRCCNNYGPFQFPEKLIPLVVTNALDNRDIPVYGNGMNIREWIFVEDHCRAIDCVIQDGKPGGIYNIGSSMERTNIELVKFILDVLGKPHSCLLYTSPSPRD